LACGTLACGTFYGWKLAVAVAAAAAAAAAAIVALFVVVVGGFACVGGVGAGWVLAALLRGRLDELGEVGGQVSRHLAVGYGLT
jgi:hypothetical protein